MIAEAESMANMDDAVFLAEVAKAKMEELEAASQAAVAEAQAASAAATEAAIMIGALA